METIRGIESGQGLVEFGEIAALARAFEVALLVPPGWTEEEAEEEAERAVLALLSRQPSIRLRGRKP